MTDTAEDVDEAIIAKVSDFIDGTLQGAERDEVATKIETDAAWKSVHDEMQEARKAISGMRKARAPETFTQDVTSTISARSKGYFFGGKKPHMSVWLALVIVAVLALAIVGYFLWSSETGSLKTQKHTEPPKTQPQVTIPP